MIEALKNEFGLNVVAPYKVSIRNELHTFQCLVEGYGAKRGMVIDNDWSKFSKVKDVLIEMGFGFSCFDIDELSTECFQEVLDDWGRVDA